MTQKVLKESIRQTTLREGRFRTKGGGKESVHSIDIPLDFRERRVDEIREKSKVSVMRGYLKNTRIEKQFSTKNLWVLLYVIFIEFLERPISGCHIVKKQTCLRHCRNDFLILVSYCPPNKREQPPMSVISSPQERDSILTQTHHPPTLLYDYFVSGTLTSHSSLTSPT